jgi:NADH:ubiquinone oxidoreductase subunit 6 (subunit J)
MSIDLIIWIVLLAALVLTSFATVVLRTLMMATVLLALTSVLLAIILFFSGMAFAAVIELSVSAGLVTAIFASAIAMLKPKEDESEPRSAKSRIRRYIALPIIMLLLAAGILCFVPGADLGLADLASNLPVDAAAREILWNERALDVIGIALLILAGVLGIATLIRRREVI